jgi:quercetin dioxygenase-like cupin family protein
MKPRKDAPMTNNIHVNDSQLEWTTASSYPAELQKVVHWKMLIGGEPPSVPQKDALMGVLDLEAGGYYPLHSHPSPEIYYIISGSAEWTVGDETFTAAPGTAIYHASNVPHRMVNHGSEALRTVWFWWAPNGERDVLQVGVQLLESMPGK